MTKRIIIDLVLLLSVFFFPPIFPMLVALFFLYYFESFYEIIFLGLVIDSLYGRPVTSLYNFSYSMTFISSAFFISSIFIKKRLKFYSDR